MTNITTIFTAINDALQAERDDRAIADQTIVAHVREVAGYDRVMVNFADGSFGTVCEAEGIEADGFTMEYHFTSSDKWHRVVRYGNPDVAAGLHAMATQVAKAHEGTI